jgi:protein gp37
MGKETTISWTDHSWNPWWGCTKVSLGCDHCYAEAFDKRVGGSHWGKGVPRRTFGDKHWEKPLKWNRAAQADGVERKVFCASMADVMDDEAPAGQRDRLWDLIDQTPNLIWQLLTKRPSRYTSYLPPDGFKHRNVWLGTTTENQHFYELRWRVLRIVAAEFDCVSFVSYEPALGPLSIIDSAQRLPKSSNPDVEDVPDWLICGGETSAGRRQLDQAWAENIADECEIAGTRFFMKQMSAQNPAKAAALIPTHLLIRQFPEAR